MYKSLVASAFRFSDYYLIFEDLKLFAQKWYSQQEGEKISDKLNQILDDLSLEFLDMYKASLSLHPTQEIQEEVDFIHFLYEKNTYQKRLDIPQQPKKLLKKSNSTNKPRKLKKEKISLNKEHHLQQKKGSSDFNNSCQPDWFMSEYYLLLGTNFNSLFLHAEAVNALSDSIRIDPTKIDAYKERAHAYFELNEIDLAIKDYWKCKELEDKQPPYMKKLLSETRASKGDELRPKGKLDYGAGFYIGIVKGGGVALIEFVPSVFSCCRGILHGLWSCACSPNEVRKDLVDASYALFEYLKTHSAIENIGLVVPELKDLVSNWDKLSDFERGNKSGYIIGKYGVDILTPGTAIIGIKKMRQLRQVNSMFTLECCAVAQEKKAKIIKKSAEHAKARIVVFEAAKKGKIIPRNANVVSHVMQEKHAWNKIIKLSGNKQEDFKKVITLLEEIHINDKINLKEVVKYGSNSLIKTTVSEYRKVVNGYELQVIFENYVETGESFLKNAWVITTKK
ncbi:MAG: tetratricopeptide repeat protein [Waddliaceae bacterium]